MIDHFEVRTEIWRVLKLNYSPTDAIDATNPFAPVLLGNYRGLPVEINDDLPVQWRAIDRQGNILAQGAKIDE